MGKTLLTIYILLASFKAMASGGEGGGHIFDLLWPFINFLILFGFLAFKMRKPISDGFTKNAKEVEELFNHAEERSKEAKIKFEMYQKKISGIDSETTRILKEADEDSATFKVNAQKSTTKNITRLEKESVNKVEQEKNNMLQSLSAELIEEVLKETKSKVGQDKDLQKKVTQSLLAKI